MSTTKITPEQLNRIAALAHLKISPQDQDTLIQQLSKPLNI